MQEKTASQIAKSHGYKSLSQLSEISGINRQTLGVWFKKRKKVFYIILIGCQRVDLLHRLLSDQPDLHNENSVIQNQPDQTVHPRYKQ